MKCNKWSWWPGAVLLCCSAAAATPTHGMDEFGQQAATVRALIHQETASLLQTLHQPRQAASSAGMAAEADHLATDQPRLVAIYGVGQGLHATVQWQGQRLQYIQGQTHAQPQLSSAWTLQSLSARCIVLRHEEQRHQACLTR